MIRKGVEHESSEFDMLGSFCSVIREKSEVFFQIKDNQALAGYLRRAYLKGVKPFWIDY
jgi:hypothetical protein